MRSKSIERLLLTVLRIGNGKRMSYETLMEHSGITRHALWLAIKEAREAGLIETERDGEVEPHARRQGRAPQRITVAESVANLYRATYPMLKARA
jgi:hypothetical protein